MKKYICILFAMVVVLVGVLTGCGNMQVLDTTVTFDRAVIELPNGETVEGKVDSWRDYDGSDQLQVKINGVTYLVHSSDCVLIKEKS